LKSRSSGFEKISDVGTKEEKYLILSNFKFNSLLKKNTKNEKYEKISIEIVEEINHENENEIVDFDLKTIVAPQLHQNTEKWVIFSDLHVKRLVIHVYINMHIKICIYIYIYIHIYIYI
jgi:hypothetical protein